MIPAAELAFPTDNDLFTNPEPVSCFRQCSMRQNGALLIAHSTRWLLYRQAGVVDSCCIDRLVL